MLRDVLRTNESLHDEQHIALFLSSLPETVFGKNGHVNSYVNVISISFGLKRICEFICEYEFNYFSVKTDM